MSITRKFGLAGAATLAALSITNAASAADMAVKAPPIVPPPVYSWTGFYVGGQVGSGWGTSQTTVDVGNTFIGPPVNNTINGLIPGALNLFIPLPQVQMNGFVGGGQAGYNWQTGVFVLGVEGDILWSGIKGTTSCILVFNCTNEVKWIGDITGRLGVTVGDRGLVYIKGGAAWADASVGINQSAAVVGPGFAAFGAVNGSVSKTVFGGTLGAGVEYGFLPGWSVKLEYDYFDFGKEHMNIPVTAAGGIAIVGGPALAGAIGIHSPISVDEKVHTVRIGVNYHFNWGQPVVARY